MFLSAIRLRLVRERLKDSCIFTICNAEGD